MSYDPPHDLECIENFLREIITLLDEIKILLEKQK